MTERKGKRWARLGMRKNDRDGGSRSETVEYYGGREEWKRVDKVKMKGENNVELR